MLEKIKVNLFSYRSENDSKGVIHASKYDQDRTNDSHPHFWIENIPRILTIQYMKDSYYEGFRAKIIACEDETLIDIETNVDTIILHKALLTNENVIGYGPLTIRNKFMWKIKGSVKLCLI